MPKFIVIIEAKSHISCIVEASDEDAAAEFVEEKHPKPHHVSMDDWDIMTVIPLPTEKELENAEISTEQGRSDTRRN